MNHLSRHQSNAFQASYIRTRNLSQHGLKIHCGSAIDSCCRVPIRRPSTDSVDPPGTTDQGPLASRQIGNEKWISFLNPPYMVLRTRVRRDIRQAATFPLKTYADWAALDAVVAGAEFGAKVGNRSIRRSGGWWLMGLISACLGSPYLPCWAGEVNLWA